MPALHGKSGIQFFPLSLFLCAKFILSCLLSITSPLLPAPPDNFHCAHKPGQKQQGQKKQKKRKQISVRLLFILFIAESLFAFWRTFCLSAQIENIIETINCCFRAKELPGICVVSVWGSLDQKYMNSARLFRA